MRKALLLSPLALLATGSALADFPQLDPLSLALLVLGGWLALSLLLVLPLVLSPFFRRRQAQGQASKRTGGFAHLAARTRRETPVSRPARAEEGLQLVPPAWSLPERIAVPPPLLPPSPQQACLAAYPPGQRETRLVDADQPSRPLCMQVSARSDAGRMQGNQENEDGFLTVTGARSRCGQLHPFGLFVVADGISGQANGREASGMTIQAISQRFLPVLTQQELPGDDLRLLLAAAIQSANMMLYQYNQCHLRPLGCTVTAALVTSQEVSICHVGKNRAYLLTEQAHIRRVTVDHSIVESLVVAGFIQRDEVYTHPRRNRIYRCLGQGPQVQIDTVRLPVARGGRLLFCSDGLWELMRDPDIEEVLRQYPDASQASSQLVALAKQHGGQDDITAILVELSDEPGPAPAQRPGIGSIDSNLLNLAL